MRILLHEIRKILNGKMLLLLAMANLIFYFLLIEFYISNFPNGRPALDSYRIGIEMIEKYGTDMDEEEILDFQKTYAAQVEEANRYLQAREEFAEAGIETYEDFRNFDPANDQQDALYRRVMFEEQVDTFWELQERARLMEFHEDREARLAAERNEANPAQRERLDAMMAAGHYQVYPEVAFENYKNFIFNVAIAVVVSVVMVVSPVMIRDRLRQVSDLQYTAKKGRHLFKTKIAAGCVCTGIVIAGLLFFYFTLYSFNRTETYFPVPIHTFIGPFYYWYDPTFFQYIVLTVAAVVLLGYVFALLAMAFSCLMPNYVSLIGVQVPPVVAMIGFGLSFLISRIIDLDLPRWAIPASYSVLVLVSVWFVVHMWRREKRRDMVG